MPDREVVTTMMQIQSTMSVPFKYNGILFINKGTATANINNFPLAAGQSIGWQHNANEVNKSDTSIDFPTGNTGANVWAIIIYYKDVQQ